MSDDRARLEHYLEWQRAWDRARAARRRRWRRGAAAALAVVGASGGAWLAGLPRTGGGVATDTRPPGPDVDGGAAAGSERSVAARRAPSPAGDVATPRPARTLHDPASRPARPPVEARVMPIPAPSPPATPGPTAEAEQNSAVAAAIATAPHPVSPTEAPAAEPAPAQAATEPVTPTSPAETSPPLPTSAIGAVPPAVTSPRVSDRAKGWLRGELQEFRDGVKREIDDARVGYRTMRRGVEQLRSRLRGD
jgi:hypothetical protein